MNAAIFKPNDVRGLYPEDLDEDDACRIGIAIGRSGVFQPSGTIIVGRDPRKSSKALSESLQAGLVTNGFNVIDIGLCTTPMMCFAVNDLAAIGGVMVTASHNPRGYNGFKIVRENAIPVGMDSGLAEIQREALQTVRADSRAVGKRWPLDTTKGYVAFFTDRISMEAAPPVIIDTGNGAVGAILPSVLKEFPEISYMPMYFEPDGTFPNHEANPLKEETLVDLKAAMAGVPGSIGVAFDGDGDRVCFVDEEGQTVRGDMITALLSRHYLVNTKRGEYPLKVLYDVRCSKIVPETILAYFGVPIRTKVGYSFIKARMLDEGAIFGGELSSHFYFSDFFNGESGIFAMLTILEIIGRMEMTLADLIRPFRKYAHSGEINYRVEDANRAIAAVRKLYPRGAKDTLDGLTVAHHDWWFNIRTSNTEPFLRLNVETKSEDETQRRVAQIAACIARA